MAQAGHEAEEIKETVWVYTQYAVVLAIVFGAGTFLGYTLWGDASSLRTDLNASVEQVNTLKNERETLKSQLALATRDKDACQKQLAAGGAQ
jgi:cell division protein FtsB